MQNSEKNFCRQQEIHTFGHHCMTCQQGAPRRGKEIWVKKKPNPTTFSTNLCLLRLFFSLILVEPKNKHNFAEVSTDGPKNNTPETLPRFFCLQLRLFTHSYVLLTDCNPKNKWKNEDIHTQKAPRGHSPRTYRTDGDRASASITVRLLPVGESG